MALNSYCYIDWCKFPYCIQCIGFWIKFIYTNLIANFIVWCFSVRIFVCPTKEFISRSCKTLIFYIKSCIYLKL